MSDAMPDPRALCRRAAQGDVRARTELVRAHGPVVWGACRRLAREPEDAYQDIWAKAFRALPDFDVEGAASFRTWLLVLAHRHLVDLHRRQAVRGDVLELPDRPDPGVDPLGRLLDDERAAHLEAGLACLPVAQRRVVVMHHLHGHALEAIAGEEGVAVGTVKSRLHRARARLAELLGGSR